MTDPLSVLREYALNGKEILERDGRIIFGNLSWPKKVQTNYRIFGSGKDGEPIEYYSLESIVYLLTYRILTHPVYVRKSAKANIRAIRRPDRKQLLNYLDGNISRSSSIDPDAPVELPTRHIDCNENEDKKPYLGDEDVKICTHVEQPTCPVGPNVDIKPYCGNENMKICAPVEFPTRHIDPNVDIKPFLGNENVKIRARAEFPTRHIGPNEDKKPYIGNENMAIEEDPPKHTKSLSEAMSKEQIAAIRAKRLAKKQATTMGNAGGMGNN